MNTMNADVLRVFDVKAAFIGDRLRERMFGFAYDTRELVVKINNANYFLSNFDDTTIRGMITGEATAREAADNALRTLIDGKQDVLTAGNNISIDIDPITGETTISATGSAGGGSDFWSGTDSGGDLLDMTEPGNYSGTWTHDAPLNRPSVTGALLVLAHHGDQRAQILITETGGEPNEIWFRPSIGDVWTKLQNAFDLPALLTIVTSKQDKLTPGDNITIKKDSVTGEWVISAVGAGQGPRGFSVVGMRLDGLGNLYYSIEEED